MDGVHNCHGYACLVTWKLGLWDELDKHLTHLERQAPRLIPDAVTALVEIAEGLEADSPVNSTRVWHLCATLYRKIGFTSKAEWAEAQCR